MIYLSIYLSIYRDLSIYLSDRYPITRTSSITVTYFSIHISNHQSINLTHKL